MDSQSVRRGITNAKFNEQAFTYLFTEIMLFSIFIGLTIGSWFAGIGVLVGSIILFVLVTSVFPQFAIFIIIGISLVWGYIGYFIGGIFGTEASFALAFFGFLAGVGIHYSALQYTGDLGN